ncbi:hypothetical protein FVO59_04345 [Microbacterium esteraromaticum]|uniref:Uncharacterized protein n=1 Tax=Microbacterium esteraromaticum TaxID=57043 RepID=A0A7D8ADK1_9MICO|nr:hypothetical protein [Microbacterium esteraromaticum]QMU96522.1 hypothetical protein FVO59_04345 [Microbacterium esteraromaticum]
MLPADWIPHRRDDGELLGWIRPEGDDWVAIDVLGRPASDAVDWLDAEAALEAVGLAWLADVWMLDGEAQEPLRVRFVEVTPPTAEAGRIVVKADDFGDMQRPPAERLVLPWPAPETLRPARAGDPDGRTIAR